MYNRNPGPLVQESNAFTTRLQVVGHPEPEKKSVCIFEYILASMLKVYLDVF